MRVPFLDLKAMHAPLQAELRAACARVLESGIYILGPEVEAFEAEFAQWCGASQCVGVANGLDALRLALLAFGVGPGDEVIVPANTYIATWLAVSECGARPVPVEPDVRTCNLDPARVEAALTTRTRVLLPVHLYGQPADLDPLLALARHHGLRLLEDGAQAHGASYKGRRIGAHGDAVTWSFYPGKNLGALGDGGAVTTNDSAVADRLRVLRNYGSRVKYVNDVRGVNSRLDPLQAAMLRVKLRHVDAWNAQRRKIAGAYLQHLRAADVVLPFIPDWADPVWHLFVVRHPRRDSLQESLRAAGIDTLIHYPIPPHLQRAYGDAKLHRGDLPITEQIHDEVLSLPMWPGLAHEQIEQVVRAVAQHARQA